jgi:hypothetical protein
MGWRLTRTRSVWISEPPGVFVIGITKRRIGNSSVELQ